MASTVSLEELEEQRGGWSACTPNRCKRMFYDSIIGGRSCRRMLHGRSAWTVVRGPQLRSPPQAAQGSSARRGRSSSAPAAGCWGGYGEGLRWWLVVGDLATQQCIIFAEEDSSSFLHS